MQTGASSVNPAKKSLPRKPSLEYNMKLAREDVTGPPRIG